MSRFYHFLQPLLLYFFPFSHLVISLDIAMGVRRGEGPAVDLLWDQICWNSVVTMERVIVNCCGRRSPARSNWAKASRKPTGGWCKIVSRSVILESRAILESSEAI